MDSSPSSPPPETRLHFLDYWRIIRIRKTVILAVFLLVVITATVVTFIYPESFASTAKIQVQPDVTDIGTMTGDARLAPQPYNPYFLQTEFEKIQSELILDPVIKELKLNEKWSKKYGTDLTVDEARRILQQNLDVSPVRNTSLIEIRVLSDTAQEAAEVANAIARQYLAYRLKMVSSTTAGGIEKLKQQATELDGRITNKQAEVNNLRTTLKISDAEAGSTGPALLIESQTYRDLMAMKIKQQEELTGMENQFNGLKSLSWEKRAQALPTALPTPDAGLNELLSQLNLAQQMLLRNLKDYGPAHPDVINASNSIALLSKQIDARMEGILNGMESKVDAARASLSNLVAEVNSAQEADSKKVRESAPYFDAKRRLDDLLRLRSALDAKLFSEQMTESLPKTTMVEIVSTAKPVLKAVRPNKPLNIALGVIVGLVVGIGLAFFIEYLDTSVKTIDDVERALGCPVLGVIPQNVGYILYEGAESPHAEAYRVLRTNLLFSRKDDKLNSLCIVSAGAGEGKTTTAINLATVFAQGGQRVLIVDSDLRRPSLHKVLRVPNGAGLTSYLLKQNTLEEVIQTTSLATLNFLPSGRLPSSSLGILNSPAMKELITELKQRFDFVIFDSPPMMGVSDASVLASEVDMTLQVVQYRRYPQPMNVRAKQMIEKVGGTLLGIVLNNINMAQDESYYYYSGYYHDYYYSKKEDEAAQSDKAGAGKDKKEIKSKY